MPIHRTGESRKFIGMANTVVPLLRFSAGKMWNALPVSLRSAEDLLTFKKGVNKHLREELITGTQSDFHFY